MPSENELPTNSNSIKLMVNHKVHKKTTKPKTFKIRIPKKLGKSEKPESKKPKTFKIRTPKEPNKKEPNKKEPVVVKKSKAKEVEYITRCKDGLPMLTVALTGALTGQILRGRDDKSTIYSCKKVVLEVAEGYVPAYGYITKHVNDEELIRAYMQNYKISRDEAKIDVKERKIGFQSVNRSLPIGSSCESFDGFHSVWGKNGTPFKKGPTCSCKSAKFIIIQPGVWMDVAMEHGTDEILMSYVKNKTKVEWRQILQLFGKHTLMLRPTLLCIKLGPKIIANPIGNVLDCRVQSKTQIQNSIVYGIDSFQIRVDKTRKLSLENNRETILQLVEHALSNMGIPMDKAVNFSLRQIYRVVSQLTLGGLKSALQKAIRFSPTHFVLSTLSVSVPIELYAAMVCACLCVHSGGFIPDLQLHTRGCTAALKRMGVILLEDSWVPTKRYSSKLQTLLGIGIITQLVQDYYPNRFIYEFCIQIAYEAAQNKTMIDWRSYQWEKPTRKNRKRKSSDLATSVKRKLIPVKTTGVQTNEVQTIGVSITGITNKSQEVSVLEKAELKHSSALLKLLGSFKGDKDMFDIVSELAHTTNKLPLLVWSGEKQLHNVPDAHIWDQHAKRGIAHILKIGNLESQDTFKKRFTNIFNYVTGINPRKDNLNYFHLTKKTATNNKERQMLEFIKQIRFAQKVTMYYSIKVNKVMLEPMGTQQISYKIDPGTLAAGVGFKTFKVKLPKQKNQKKARKARNLSVVMGTVDPEDEKVMLSFSRAKVSDYMDWSVKGDEEFVEMEKEDAIRQFREKKSHTVKSPLLPKGVATFNEEHGTWMFNGKIWADIVAKGITKTVKLHKGPTWLLNFDESILENNQAIMEALMTRGTGIIKNAEQHIKQFCSLIRPQIVTRAVSLMKQQYKKIAMPTPALDGGVGTDQLQAYRGDWDVWRFLVLLSRLVPGALRPTTPPNFTVLDGSLLNIIIEWIVNRPSAKLEEMEKTQWHQHKNFEKWNSSYKKSKTILKEHQKDAIELLTKRSKRGLRGHFLVMDTGCGKTYTSLCFMMWRLLHTNLGNHIKRIIWITPPGKKLNKFTTGRSYSLISDLMNEFSGKQSKLPVPVHFVQKNEKKYKDFTLNIVHYDQVRSMLDTLVNIASTSYFLFDEVDEFYSAGTQRTSNGLRLASLCPEFIAQTATPIPTKGKIERMAQWLGMTENYPVTQDNYFVAACNMVMLKVVSDVKRVYMDPFTMELTDRARAAFLQYKQNRDWRQLFTVLQDETNLEFCKRAVYWATKDRAITPNGGCFVVCETSTHVQTIIGLIRKHYPTIPVGDIKNLSNDSYHIVCVASKNCRGYNNGVRLGVQIRQPYPGNASCRKQMEGRIWRLTQKRAEVYYEVVYMKNTMMQLLHERHLSNDCANYALDSLALEYEKSVMDDFGDSF